MLTSAFFVLEKHVKGVQHVLRSLAGGRWELQLLTPHVMVVLLRGHSPPTKGTFNEIPPGANNSKANAATGGVRAGAGSAYANPAFGAGFDPIAVFNGAVRNWGGEVGNAAKNSGSSSGTVMTDGTANAAGAAAAAAATEKEGMTEKLIANCAVLRLTVRAAPPAYVTTTGASSDSLRSAANAPKIVDASFLFGTGFAGEHEGSKSSSRHGVRFVLIISWPFLFV
jgi:hypothetical protein